MLVHSHGWEGYAGNSAFRMRAFASHGWVVVAPEHTGNTILENWDPFPSAFDYLRSADVAAALDSLASVPAADPLAGCCDTSSVVLSGHSYGAYTAWASAGVTYDMAREAEECPDCTDDQLARFAAGLGDPRVAAIIPMAGVPDQTQRGGPDGSLTIDVPVLYMNGSLDGAAEAQALFDEPSALELTWVQLEGGCHNTFGLPTCSTLAPELGYRIVETYALAFARRHLLEDTDPTTTGILDGSVEVVQEAQLRRR